MALDSKKAVCFLKSGVSVLSVYCYRFARKHPFITSLLFIFGVLYVYYPRVFFFLVSSSPVVISTALLLGTLLSLGRPHIPQIDDLEEEEENLGVSSRAHDDDEKSKINNISKERSDQDQQVDGADGDAADSGVVGLVTKVSKRRFEEAIDDFSASRYIDAETLLGRRTEIVETIEEEEEQFNVEDLDDNGDQIRNDKPVESVDFKATHKKEEEEVAAIENKETTTVVDESKNNLDASLEKEPDNMAHGEEVSEKTGEKASLEGAEGHAIECEDQKEENEMENNGKAVIFSDTDSITERSFEKPRKEHEEGIPLLGLSSSSLELHEERFHVTTIDMDASEGTSKSKGLNGKAEDKVECEPDAEENAPNDSSENIFLSLQSSWRSLSHRRISSDSGSDAAESISSDASLGQLDPMFDEHHPLLDYQASKAPSVSNSSVEEGFNVDDFSPRERGPKDFISFPDEHHEEGFHVDDFSPRERVPKDFISFPDERHAPSELHDEEEEEEEHEAIRDFGFTWTEDDEKNLRDLGLSEWERMEHEKRLIAHLHVHHSQGAQEENVMDCQEKPLFMEEENLVEIGVAKETAATEQAFEIPSESVDRPLERQTDSAGKENPLEMITDSTNREILVEVQPESRHKEEKSEIQFDQVRKDDTNELLEDKSSNDRQNLFMQNDLTLQEDQSQPVGDACPADTHHEKANFEVSSIENTESASSVIAEDAANKHEQAQAGSLKDSLQSFETVEAPDLDSSPEFHMPMEGTHTVVASVEEEQPQSLEKVLVDDDLSSLSSSSHEIEMPAMEGTAEESANLHEEYEIISQKDFEHHSEDAQADQACSVPVMEMQTESQVTVPDVISTAEHESGVEEGKESSDDSRSSISEEIELMTRERMEKKPAIIDEDVQDACSEAAPESNETISRDASSVREMPIENLSAADVVALSKSQYEKMEETSSDSSSPTLDEIESVAQAIIAEESDDKHEMTYFEPLKAGEKSTESLETIEKDVGLQTETQKEMASTEEHEPKEEKSEKDTDDSSSSASEETESKSREFIQEVPSKHDEVHSASPKASHGPIEVLKDDKLDSLPAVDIHGDSLLTAEHEDLAEAEESMETKEASDDLDFSESNIGTSENQKGLIMLEVKSKEELESAFEHVVSNELDNEYEESQSGAPKANEESTENFESIDQDSTREILMPIDGDGEDAPSQEQQPMPDEAKSTSDDSSSSASDISSPERLEELTFLEVNSKDQTEAALKEAIAEELASEHKEIQVSSSQATDHLTDIVKPTKLDSPPVIDMQREISPTAEAGASMTEEHQPKPGKTEESYDDLNSAAMEVRKSPSSDGGEIQ